MKSNIKNIFFKLKPLVYALWFIVITFLAINIFKMGINDNTQGSQCDYYVWQIGKVYQWIWDKQPCLYTIEFLAGYIFYVILYILFDYIRRQIIGINPSVRWRIFEVCIWFVLKWGCLLYFTITDYGVINLTILITSFLGVVLFFIPITIFAVVARFLSNRLLLYLLFTVIIICLVLFVFL